MTLRSDIEAMWKRAHGNNPERATALGEVLVLLDGAVEVEGWANLGVIEDGKVPFGNLLCVIGQEHKGSIFPDHIHAIFLQGESDEHNAAS